ncbi:MAG TPA: hypothetical protein VKZ89_05200 [Thermobifida alba]|nr:hypothetical protein [Thermobifida alba]
MKPSDPLNTRMSAGYCPTCGKLSYLTRRAAKHVSRSAHHENLRPYRCQENPGIWHIGHNPGWRMRGEDRSAA